MANPFAGQLADALENSWPAIARPNQLPPPGDWWQIWIPTGRLHLPVAPDCRIGEALQLGVAGARIGHFGHARAPDRAEARIHRAIGVGLDDYVHVLRVLADDVVHRRRIPG